MVAINSPEHAIHTDGFMMAMADRLATYRSDPEPRMRKYPLPAITLSQEQAARVREWFDGIEWTADEEDRLLALALELAALGDDPEHESEAAPGFPRARDFNETPASEWAKLEGENDGR